MVEEAQLTTTENGLVPRGEGWFVVNAREARWWESDAFDRYCRFQGDVHFPEVGFNISVLLPGRPGCMYHGEDSQEDFLVVSGECLLLVEGEERLLKAWDFVHCPKWTEHIFVGAGDGPCVVVGVGRRKKGRGLRYPVNELALSHGAAVEVETTDSEEAYKGYSEPKPIACPPEFPPD